MRPAIVADIFLPTNRLSTIALIHKTTRKALRIIWQNLGFAAVYNEVLIPLAVLGHAALIGVPIVVLTLMVIAPLLPARS